jgi:2-desacetyl-2-hydroxyethyl bacteriochlorophyllide A dehydrogenase
MLTASYVGDGTLQVAHADAVPPAPGEVQVRVAYVGICGTDLHILHGAMDGRVAMPGVIGHEMSGTVEEVGAGVTRWSPGDPVTVMPLSWDDTCPACLASHRHLCHNLDFIGIDSPGALQGLWNVPAEALVPLRAHVPLRHGALVEPVAVAVHDVRRSGLAAGESAVVLGGGPIGVLIAVVARDLGVRVLVSEPDAGRRATIEALGMETVDPADVDLAGTVEEWTGGTGADVVFEVSGSAAAVLTATAVARVRGTVVVVAIHPRPVPVDLQRVFWRELRLLGARVYERQDFERAAGLVADGVIPAERLITGVMPITDVEAAFATLEAGQAMKVLVDVQEGAE